MRSLGLAVVLAALVATGCGHRERKISAADRRRCDDLAATVSAAGTQRYKGIVDECVHTLEQPVRGGG